MSPVHRAAELPMGWGGHAVEQLSSVAEEAAWESRILTASLPGTVVRQREGFALFRTVQ